MTAPAFQENFLKLRLMVAVLSEIEPDVQKNTRNPKWSREELILALELYHSADGKLLDDKDERVIRLSEDLAKLSATVSRNPTYRNPNGVSMKLANFSRFDARYLDKGRAGLQRGGKADEEIWNEFYGDHDRLNAEAMRISELIVSSEDNTAPSHLGTGQPALFAELYPEILDQTHELFKGGRKEMLFGTNSLTFAPVLKEPVSHIYFKARNQEIEAVADFIDATTENAPELRLPGREKEKWKYFYKFRNFRKLENPVSILSLRRFPSNLPLTSASGGVFRIRDIDLEYSNQIEDDTNAEKQLMSRNDIGATQKLRLYYSRLGQGPFRKRLQEVEKVCRMTGLSKDDGLVGGYLHASHIKPWSVSTDCERLDGNNGLWLSPHAHHLFDSGLISFAASGEIRTSQNLPESVLECWAVRKQKYTRPFTEEQKNYLRWHWNKFGFSEME